MLEKQQAILTNILNSINKIEGYTLQFSTASEFNENIAMFDATVMNFIIIGEMASKLDEIIKDDNSHIDWRKIIALRNIFAHNYFGIDEEEIWQIVKEDLPLLKLDIISILNKI